MLPVTVTVYAPGETDFTVKLPVAMPPEIVHETVVASVAGSIGLHDVSVSQNPEPLTITDVPVGPLVGERVTVGPLTVKLADAVSAVVAVPVTVTTYVPAATLPTVKLKCGSPVPAEITQVGEVA